MLRKMQNILRALRGWCGALAAMAVCCAAVLLWPMDTARYLAVHPSGEMQDASGRLMYAMLDSGEQWCFARELGAISPYLVQATIAAEDQRFYRHPGADPVAVVRAVWQNASGGRVVSGASTLTMQVVKAQLGGSRSLIAKARQALEAVRLECRSSKKDILEAYLNGAPYGLNLVGCEAASRRYFGKPASELTLSEAALLAGLPKSPSAYMPLSHPERAVSRRNAVLRRMRDEGYIAESQYREALAVPLDVSWHAFPKLAPHLAMRLKSELVAGRRIRVTLDAALQRRVEALAANWVKRFDGGITNAAVIVIDVETAATVARVGSVDFFAPGAGQVDVCRAPRSPGSALKPFVYALAMEQQKLYACETLLDDSIDYGLYNPGNFDREYNGLLPAGEALRRSLNVPAITVLGRVGVERADAFLESAGLTSLSRPAEDYGLGLTIGDCEVRLEELGAAYCMLANLGEYRPVRLLAEGVSGPERLLSRGVCLKVFEMLEQTFPTEFSRGIVRATTPPSRVCWKTGTSTGLRDAWAFVFNRHYVTGVWVGNSSGRSSPELIGSHAALPLAAKVFRALEAKETPAWPEVRGDLHAVTVCAASGLPAAAWCARTRTEWLPRCQYLHRKCDMHYPNVERWPASARGWDLATIEKPVELPRAPRDSTKPSGGPLPAFSPEKARGLRILTPIDKAEYVLTGEPDGDRIKLRTSVDTSEPVHWYLDDAYIGDSGPALPRFLQLEPGPHKLACLTQSGILELVHFAVHRPTGQARFNAASGG